MTKLNSHHLIILDLITKGYGGENPEILGKDVSAGFLYKLDMHRGDEKLTQATNALVRKGVIRQIVDPYNDVRWKIMDSYVSMMCVQMSKLGLVKYDKTGVSSFSKVTFWATEKAAPVLAQVNQ